MLPVGSARVEALFDAQRFGPQVLVKVERPQRNEDERHPLCQPLGRTFVLGAGSDVGGGSVFSMRVVGPAGLTGHHRYVEATGLA